MTSSRNAIYTLCALSLPLLTRCAGAADDAPCGVPPGTSAVTAGHAGTDIAAVPYDTASGHPVPPHAVSEGLRKSVSLRVSPADSAVLQLGEARLSVPADAVEDAVTISMTELTDSDLPRIPGGLVNVTRHAAGYRFLPHGHHFTKAPARVELPVDTAAIPRGYAMRDVFVYFYDGASSGWVALPKDTSDSKPLMARALTSHFTDMIAGVLEAPDMPETQGFAPTALTGVKAADPTAGIVTIEAPRATQSGAATLSYPIPLPAGRNGMQPSLALTYSSEGRSGWCGYGWSMRMPSIDIDTRWGVPRFDARCETEIYLINGEQTTLMPHRAHESMERTTDREFHLRVESAFARIERKGGTPKDYYWVVTTRDGVVMTYGDSEDSRVVNAEGNIVHWALSKTGEPHGDNVTYTYAERGGYLYPEEIRYTNHGGEDGEYVVRLDLCTAGDFQRRDISTSCRLAMPRTDSELLKAVSVYRGRRLMHRIEPIYEVGALRRTLLREIRQLDSRGETVGTHRFDYYDDIRDGLFEEPREWAVGSDKALEGNLIEKIGMTDGLSAIGGSRSTGTTNGGGASVGVGASPIPKVAATISVNAGFSMSYSHSRAHSDVSMTDIDGDGRPDKVFADGDHLYYRKNISENGNIAFAEPQPIRGVSRMSFSESKTTSRNFNTGIGVKIGIRQLKDGETSGEGKGNVNASYSRGSSRTWDWTHTYMRDFNGDGLVDIAEKGRVFFNHIDSDGRPYFTRSSDGTPNPVWSPSAPMVSAEFLPDTAAERREMEKANPLVDAVRVWRAPYDGNVLISGTAGLKDPKASTDGVKVAIQHERDEIWSGRLYNSDCSASHSGQASVKAGDRIMFRTHSVYGGASDATLWDPVIEYVSCEDVETASRYDANGCDLLRYRAAEDFLHAGSSGLTIIGPCTAAIKMQVGKRHMRDDVRLDLFDDSGRTLWTRTYGRAQTIDAVETISVPVAGGDTMTIYATAGSRSPLDWRGLRWNVSASYEMDGDPHTACLAPQIDTLYAKSVRVNGASILRSVKMSETISAAETDSTDIDSSWVFKESGLARVVPDRDIVLTPMMDGLRFSPDTVKECGFKVVLTDMADNGPRTIAVLDGGRVANRRADSLSMFVDSILLVGRKVSADIYADAELSRVATSELLAGRWETLIYTDTYADTAGVPHGVRREERRFVHCDTLRASVSSALLNQKLGNMYRGWGQFAWSDSLYRAIDVDELEYSADLNDDMARMSESPSSISKDQMEGLGTAASSPFLPMAYSADGGRYVSVRDSVFVAAGEICPSRRLESEIVVSAVDYDAAGYEMSALRPRSLSEGESESASGAFTKFASGDLGANWSKTTTTTYQSVADLNGDRYPDWLSLGDDRLSVQYTRMGGSLGDDVTPTGVEPPSSQGRSKGGSAGGGGVAYALTRDNGSNTSKFAILAGKIGQAGMSLSGNLCSGSDYAVRDMVDINGDGLPDMLYSDGSVRLNMGYSFGEPIASGAAAIRRSETESKGFGGGFNIPITNAVSVGGGISYSRTDNTSTFSLTDVDGDGLPDIVDGEKVYLNNGSGFESEHLSLGPLNTSGRSISKSANGNFGVGHAFPVWLISITGSVGYTGSGSSSFNRTERMVMDIDGDGYVDIVSSESNDKVRVRRNRTGRTNLLRRVTMPLGATTTIDYERAGNTRDLPQCRRVMSRVTTRGGDRRNGATCFATSFAYADGYYDRFERDFFGFGTVRATQLDTEDGDKGYRTTTWVYDNRTYETRGREVLSYTTTADGDTLSKTATRYLVAGVHDGISKFVAPEATTSTTCEPGGEQHLTLTETFSYDAHGNISSFASAAPSDSYTTTIKYHTLADKGIYSRPSEVTVTADGQMMRHTRSAVNGAGDICTIEKLLDADNVARYDMEHDEYGNVTRLTGPDNAGGERFWRSYEYDGALHALVTRVGDAFGYKSSVEYDDMWGAPRTVTDINGNRMTYAYDHRGRMTAAAAPYEADGDAASVAVEYDDKKHVCTTTNYDSRTGNSIKTYIFVDDLGRIAQSKRFAVVREGGADKGVLVVSGAQVFDAMGRKVAEGQPVTEPPGMVLTLNTTGAVNATRTDFDVKDRPVSVTLPDGTRTTMEYDIVDIDGESLMRTGTTDANGHTTEAYGDVRGRGRRGVQHVDGRDAVTTFDYSAIGELLAVTHPDGKTTTYTYDKLGRKTSVSHPDAGQTSFEYDAAGNMTARQTANLRAVDEGGRIEFTYDYNRLREIVYPKNIYNRVTYTYGDTAETKYNRAGRLKLVEDGSGGEAYYYGKMGEVVRTVKTIMLSEADIRTYVWQAEYDSWNRVHTMTYPDGEVVSYGYDKGGNLQSVVARADGRENVIIADQGYDKYGNLTYRKTGDGTETTYEYDELRRHLNAMRLTADGSTMMESRYTYDAVDNILGINSAATRVGDIGSTYSHSYTYDALNRLVGATGEAGSAKYDLAMRYDVMGNPLSKALALDGCKTSAVSDTVDYEYSTPLHPNAVSRVGSRIFTYDLCGNPTVVEDTATNTMRVMQWDEENRLMALGDDGYVSRYTYNHTGERVIKSHGPTTSVFVNGAPQGVLYHDMDNWTMYVSPYMVVTPERFTKHYYVGTQRVASTIGTGAFANLYSATTPSVTAGQKDYAERVNLISQTREDYYVALGIAPGPVNAKGVYGEAEYTGHYGTSSTKMLGDYSVPDNWPQKAHRPEPGGVPGPPVQYEKPMNPDGAAAGYGYQASISSEPETFFYHSDHLGSTSYVTDRDGRATQFVCYMPYGESLVDEHAVSYESPFKFNGKELDNETGLYYYGARYYEPGLCLWYGVDALAEKYPSLGGYVYCAGNPVRLVDVDGNDWYEAENGALCHTDCRSQAEMDKLGIKGMYIGAQGLGINENNGNMVHYCSDGNQFEHIMCLDEVEVTAKQISSFDKFRKAAHEVLYFEGHRDGMLAPKWDAAEFKGALNGVGMLFTGVLNVGTFGTALAGGAARHYLLGGVGVLSMAISADDMTEDMYGNTFLIRSLPEYQKELENTKTIVSIISLVAGVGGTAKTLGTKSYVETGLNVSGVGLSAYSTYSLFSNNK